MLKPHLAANVIVNFPPHPFATAYSKRVCATFTRLQIRVLRQAVFWARDCARFRINLF